MTTVDPIVTTTPHILEFIRRVHCSAERHQALQPADPYAQFYYAMEAEVQMIVHDYADRNPSIQRQLDAYYACQAAMNALPPPALSHRTGKSPTGEHDLSALADHIDQLLATRTQQGTRHQSQHAPKPEPAGLDDPELAAHLSAILDNAPTAPVDPALDDNLQELVASCNKAGATVYILHDVDCSLLHTNGDPILAKRQQPTVLLALWPRHDPISPS